LSSVCVHRHTDISILAREGRIVQQTTGATLCGVGQSPREREPVAGSSALVRMGPFPERAESRERPVTRVRRWVEQEGDSRRSHSSNRNESVEKRTLRQRQGDLAQTSLRDTPESNSMRSAFFSNTRAWNPSPSPSMSPQSTNSTCSIPSRSKTFR